VQGRGIRQEFENATFLVLYRHSSQGLRATIASVFRLAEGAIEDRIRRDRDHPTIGGGDLTVPFSLL